MKEKYQFTAELGDVVELPNGRLGVIADWNILCGGNCREILIYPLFISSLRRLLGTILGCYRFYDDQINQLKKVGCAFCRC